MKRKQWYQIIFLCIVSFIFGGYLVLPLFDDKEKTLLRDIVKTVEDEGDNTLYRGLESDCPGDDMVDNPDVGCMYPEGSGGFFLGSNYDLVIITTNVLKDGFEPLKEEHDADGLKTLIYTTESIYSEYSG